MAKNKFNNPIKYCFAFIFLISVLIIPDGSSIAILYLRKSLIFICAAFYFIVQYSNKKDSFYNPILYFFAAFIVLLIISSLWADYPNALWDKLMMWLHLAVILFFFSQETFLEDKTNQKLIQFAFIFNTLLAALLFIWIAISGIPGFNFTEYRIFQKFIGENENYLAILLLIQLVLDIHIRFKNRKGWTILHIVPILIILLLNSKGASLLLLLYLSTLLLSKNKILAPKKLILSSLLVLLFMLIIVSKMPDQQRYIKNYNPIETLLQNTGDDRLDIWETSFQLIKERPLLGSGTGSWYINYPKFGLEKFERINDTPNYYTHAHNIFIETWSENGIMGLTLLLLIFLYPVWKSLKQRILHLAFIIIICFLSVNIYQIFYMPLKELSGVQYIWLLALGAIFNAKNTPNSILQKILVFCMLFFLLSYTISKYLKLEIRESIRTQKLIEPNEKLENISKVFHPVFFRYLNTHSSLSLIADQLAYQKKYKEAFSTYELALADHPYKYTLLYKTGEVAEKLKRRKKASLYMHKALEINPRFYPAKISLMDIAIRTRNWNLFDKQKSFYYEYLLPLWEEQYSEQVWDSPFPSEIEFWIKRCRQLDQVHRLFERRNKLMAAADQQQ